MQITLSVSGSPKQAMAALTQQVRAARTEHPNSVAAIMALRDDAVRRVSNVDADAAVTITASMSVAMTVTAPKPKVADAEAPKAVADAPIVKGA